MSAAGPAEIRPRGLRLGGNKAEPGERESDADRAITAIYRMQYSSLVRMAAVLVGDVSTAEEVVQDSFIAVHGAWRRLRDVDMAVRHLRRSVVNRSRSVLRQGPAGPHGPAGQQAGPAGQQALERPAMISALRTLPARQREALVLKFYLDLEDKQVASAMGISPGAVNSHVAGAKAALRSFLEET